MKNVLLQNKELLIRDTPVSKFPEQLQNEPNVSRNYVDSFDGKCTYTAAQNQNSCFYEEGIRHFYGSITKEMISEALSKF